MIVIVRVTNQKQFKKNVIPIKSPHLLVRQIDDKHFYAVNCAYPHSLRVINKPQYDILTAIDNQTSVSELSERFSVSDTTIENYLNILAQTEIIKFDKSFSIPQKPTSPNSLNFWIHTTNRCNLSCGYCYISTLNTTNGMQVKTQSQLLRKLVETVNNRKITNIKLRLAGGEPLSQFKEWKDFIRNAKTALKALGCDLTFSFLTNLTILNDDILSFAKEYNIRFGVSLDGLGKYNDNERSFRNGKGSFKVIDQNIQKFLAHKIPISVNTVVSNQNLEGLPELTRYLINLDVPFRYSIVKGEAINPDLLEGYLKSSYMIMQQAIEDGWSFTHRHQFCDLKPIELGFQTCASGFSGGAIYIDGGFNYCHVNFGTPYQGAFSIFDEDLDLMDMIEQGNHIEDMKSADCKLCKFKAVCTSGCPVYRINGKDPQCSIYHTFIPLIYELAARERLKILKDYRMMEA